MYGQLYCGLTSSYNVNKKEIKKEIMHMRGCLHNLETPFQCAKKLRYKVMKHAFTRVRAVYREHPVSDYTRASRGHHVG